MKCFDQVPEEGYCANAVDNRFHDYLEKISLGDIKLGDGVPYPSKTEYFCTYNSAVEELLVS